MKEFFGYIRVSTQKQGEGVSLQEQRVAIERYAARHGLRMAAWFEERETAARRGRPIFGRMLKELRRGKVHGVIIHKIDRSARNLKDWADLGELIDGGIEVHVATESLDLNSRSGRLSADIQAVVAADYVRNLREEARKGFYGRLSQGVYPLPAPVGYLDRGAGKPKEPDPETAPLVRRAFELYASGDHSLTTLQSKLARMGLRNRWGNRFSRSGLSTMLRNTFYIGMIRITRTGETFRGGHRPIIPNVLFDRVQAMLDGKSAPKAKMHFFLFQGMFRCAACGHALTGERQKGRVYYRCHTPSCPASCIREDRLEEHIAETLSRAALGDEEMKEACDEIERMRASSTRDSEAVVQELELRFASLKSRSDRLIDAYIDQVIDKATFESRKAGLLKDELQIQEQLEAARRSSRNPLAQVSEIFELAKGLDSAYVSAPASEKRDLLSRVSSNRLVNRKNVEITLKSPFQELADLAKCAGGGAYRTDLRILARKFAGEAYLRIQHPSA